MAERLRWRCGAFKRGANHLSYVRAAHILTANMEWTASPFRLGTKTLKLITCGLAAHTTISQRKLVMQFRRSRQLVVLLCVALACNASLAFAQSEKKKDKGSKPAASVAAPVNATRPRLPRLVVGIVIDQFRYDNLQRFASQFVEGGFNRLLKGGAVFANANYIHTPTYTACGHATFMSGAPPSLTGIVGNEWFDREADKRITSVVDTNTKLLGGKEGATGMSPYRLLGDTLGDEMRLASNQQAKVIGLSDKDRSAILPVGKRPNGAYWYDLATGNYVSSTYYFNELPAWVAKFNQEQRPDQWFGKQWVKLLPEAAYQNLPMDDAPYERSPYGRKFPYTVNGGEDKPGPKFYTQFDVTPFANERLVKLAQAAIENEALGADDVTDLLTISFSANDLIGHSFGPYSHEVADVTWRTDRLLADFFGYLDKKIGLNNVVIVLTADHGVAPIPEQVRPLGYGGRIEPKAITDAVQSELSKRFGEEAWVKNFVNGNVYLDLGALERRKADAAEAEEIASRAAAQTPGVGAVFTRSQIMAGRLPQTMVARSVAHGFHPQRNGNLVIVPAPFHFISEGTIIVTTHGTPYGYDTHVPVLFFGAGIKAGVYQSASSPADIAPTLAALLGVQAPSNSIGRVLQEALKP